MEPQVARWYDTDNEERFKILSIDREEDLIEVQYFDGDIEELTFSEWEDMVSEHKLEEVEAPEGWDDDEEEEDEEDEEEYDEDYEADGPY